MDLSKLSYPSLNTVRAELVRDLSALDDANAQATLKISAAQLEEATANRELLTAPTLPAIERYTGVLYDALDATTLPAEALDHIRIGSALFGIVRADDWIPHYRLSGGAKVPLPTGSTPTLKARWGGLVTEALSSDNEVVVDLRSGTYQQLGRVKNAITVRVEKDGKVVSHFNKHYRGLVARQLATQPSESIEQVHAVLTAARMRVEQRSSTELCLVL